VLFLMIFSQLGCIRSRMKLCTFAMQKYENTRENT
jgi:hypothetical protein